MASGAAHRRTGPAPLQSANWFSDLKLHRDFSVTVRKTGVRITSNELTGREVRRFIGYLVLVMAQALAVRMSGRKAYRICFLPDRPRPWHVIWTAAALSGARFTRDPECADVIFYFEDTTVGAAPVVPGRRVLNAGIGDISKSRIARMFAEVAGYDLLVDPTTFRGAAVEKSETNGLHDGQIVDCPRPARAGKCYQRLVDCSDGVCAFDFRTTIIGRRPRFVVVKSKPVADRFSIHNSAAELRPLERVFTPAEVELIERYARAIELDWGALDVLRDRQSGRLYVVDVNKTDIGPPVDLSLKDREALKAHLSRAFMDLMAENVALGQREEEAHHFG